MKNAIILILITICMQNASGQVIKNKQLYLGTDFNLGNYKGFDIHLNYVLPNRYTLKMGYTGNLRKPLSQPDDYQSGLIDVFLLGLSRPFDQMETYQLGFGKILPFNHQKNIRAHLSVGIGYTIIKEPHNWQRDGGGWGSGNYTWDYNKYRSFSFVINPRIEFPFTRIYGLSISPMVQICKNRTYYGIGIGQMIGKLKEKNNRLNE